MDIHLKNTDNLSAMGERAARNIHRFSFACLPLVMGIGWYLGNPFSFAAVLSLAFLGLSTIAMAGSLAVRRMGSALGLIGQAVAFTAAFAGQSWQADAHMSFFAGLAMLTAMADVGVLLAATGLIVVHHLSFGLFWPGLVYPSADMVENVARSLFHGMMVAVETVVLVLVVFNRRRMQVEAEGREADLAGAITRAEDSVHLAETARAEAEAEKAVALAAKAEAEAAQAEIIAGQARADHAARELRVMEAREAEAQRAAEARTHAAVEALRAALARLSGGDLTVAIADPFSAEYEDLRRDFNMAVTNLGRALSMVVSVAGEIRGEAGSISGSTAALADKARKQADHLRETAGAMSDLSGSVAQAAHLARAVESSTGGARSDAEKSRSVVQEAVSAINAIAESSAQISRITSVIDEIAFQTNLLALNAGVEAARAGDAGKGFAVVASEVRALAQRSSDAAREIAQLIQLSGRQVQEGVLLAGQTGEALDVITRAISGVAGQVSDISRGAQEQAGGIDGLSRAITEIDRATQANATALRDASAACLALSGGTERVIDLLAQFAIPGADPAAARKVA